MLTYVEMTVGRGIKGEVDNLGYPAAIKYLRDRGIPASLIDDLGIRILPAAEVMGRARGVTTHDDRLAIIFPHFNLSGDYIDWWSSRLVETGLRPAVVSFASVLEPRARGKMFCPPNEAPHAYLPPTLDWSKLGRGDKVYFHESVIKSMNGALLGYWSIGLNGVYGWSSKKHGQTLVRELLDLPWKAKELEPVIVFDSNADKDTIKNAIVKLASKLYEITGRRARHLLLPKSPEGGDWGFDDYVVRHGEKIAKEFLDGETIEIDLDPLEVMKLQFNDMVAVIRSISRYVELDSGIVMTRNSFVDTNYAKYEVMVERANGTHTPLKVAPRWIADPRRTEVHGITYAPGEDKIYMGDYNGWRGMGLEPAGGAVNQWLALLECNMPNPELRKWVEAWFAYPLQNLGKKNLSFIHLFGPPGSGKQALLHPLMRIYGGNSVTISRREISSDFNSIYANKQFINLDELHGGTDRDAVAVTNRIKILVTSPNMIINSKGNPEYTVPNRANLVTTCNYSDSIRLDDDDRRAAVIRFGVRGGQWGKEQWNDYFKWADGDGAASLYSYLLGVDIGWYNPEGAPPMTEEKGEVTLATRSPLEQWVMLLEDDPDQAIPDGVYKVGRCLFTPNEIAGVCFAGDPQGLTPGKVKSLGVKMYSAGFKKVAVKIGKEKVRFWIVRERDVEWTPDMARKHLRLHGVTL